jgi:1-acyl-sn-glycerol-3-phosphate acyltransferase
MAVVTAILRSLLFYVAYYGGTFVLVVMALPVSLVNNRWAFPIIGLWARLHRICVTAFLNIRVEVKGELPEAGVLVAMKHESFFDALELPSLFKRPVVFAKAELLRIPIWGWLGGVHGLIPVERSAGAKALRSMLSAAKAHLGSGRVFVIFPEGTRVQHGTTPPLQAGFAALYKALGLPVVPIAVDSGLLYHRRWKRPGTITLAVGETIPPGLPREEIEQRVHAAINALNT